MSEAKFLRDLMLAPLRRRVAGNTRSSPASGIASTSATSDVDVLELTEAVADDGSVRHLAPFSATAAGARFRPAGAPTPDPPALDDQRFDEIVAEELRPMVEAWLEAHLPAIVERLVAADIARIAGRSQSG